MEEPYPDLWLSRDLLVLRACVAAMDRENDLVMLDVIANETGLAFEDVQRSVLALDRDRLVDGLKTTDGTGTRAHAIRNVAGDAYRKVGAWPTPDTMADRLLTALEDLAEYSDDQVTRTKARKALDGLGSFSRDVLVAVVGTAAGTTMQ